MPTKLSAALEANKGLQCRAPGCTRERYRIGGYCLEHATNLNKWGHHRGRAIRPKELAPERKAVEEFLKANANHPAVLAACRFFTEWMEKANHGEEVPSKVHAQRLSAHGVPPIELVTRVISMFLYFRRRPNHLDDGELLTANLGNYVLRAGPLDIAHGKTVTSGSRRYPRRKAINPSERKATGRFLRAALSGFTANACAGIEAAETRKLTERAELNTPFT